MLMLKILFRYRGIAMSSIPYELIHEIEDKYGSLSVPDDNPLLARLHRKTRGIIPTRKRSKTSKTVVRPYRPNSFDYEVIDLIRKGYSATEVVQATGHARQTIKLIVGYYHLKYRQAFTYRYKEVYLSGLSNLKYWNIKAVSKDVAQLKTDNQIISKRYHWCDLPKGAKYMIKDNNTEIFVKE